MCKKLEEEDEAYRKLHLKEVARIERRTDEEGLWQPPAVDTLGLGSFMKLVPLNHGLRIICSADVLIDSSQNIQFSKMLSLHCLSSISHLVLFFMSNMQYFGKYWDKMFSSTGAVRTHTLPFSPNKVLLSTQSGLEFLILLSQLPECWDNKQGSAHTTTASICWEPSNLLSLRQAWRTRPCCCSQVLGLYRGQKPIKLWKT